MSAPHTPAGSEHRFSAWRQRFLTFAQNKPHLLLLGLMLLIPLFLMHPAIWLMLTISGFAMGAMLFLMASGMTLTFGLMSVLNLAHGAFISLGAFVAAGVLTGALGGFTSSPSILMNLMVVIPALGAALLVAGLVGWLFEVLVIKPVYGDHLKQILVTVGGSIVLIQLIEVYWGANEIPVPRPSAFRGSFMVPEYLPLVGGIVLEKYRLIALARGLAVYA
ncbi:MAG: branched-chain amino acid ABC transporter permease, partial [Natronospirillum sp.]